VAAINTSQFAMQLRLFRHFVPVSVVLLASSDVLLITGAFYQLLSHSGGIPIVLGASSFSAQFSLGLSFATVTAMISVGLYGQQSFVDFRLLFSKIAVSSILVLMLVSLSATYWRSGLAVNGFRKFSDKGDANFAALRLGNARHFFCDTRPWSAETACLGPAEGEASEAHRWPRRCRTERIFPTGIICRYVTPYCGRTPTGEQLVCDRVR